MIGIYKITNPKGKIYIGQSINIKNRWEMYYKSLRCSKQPKLYNSFKKYGVENHTFEIIEECLVEQLDEREIYWGLHFKVLEENGLNLRLGKGRGICSEETKRKMSIFHSGKNKFPNGRIFSEEHKLNLRKEKKKGRKHSEETKQKLKEKGRPIIQYDLEGNFIREWPNQKKACIELNINPPALNNNLKLHPNYSCAGYKWKYK